MFSFLPKSKDLQQLAVKAEAAKSGRAGEAEKLLRQMILLETEIEKSPALEEEKQADRKVLAKAFLDLGEICEKKSAHGEALAHYGKARFLGAALTPAAWARLAETYAAEGSTSDYALGAYFAYIQQRPLDASSAKVYAALESVSRVDEHTVSDARKRAGEIAKRVIAANSALEWPYYYLAVAYLQDGELPAAMINLARAQKRNPNRAMTYYWMGACLLREAEGSLEDAVEWFSKFFAFPPDDPHIAELQASAALELGKRLAVQSGGSRRALQEAVPYLELALSRGAAIEGVELSDAHELLARFFAAAGRYAEAETHSRAALSWKGRQPMTLGYLLRALYGQEKLVEVIREWEQGPQPQASPEAGEAIFCVARAYSRLGKFASALELLDQLPPEPRVIYYAGCGLANLGRLDEARSKFQKLASAGEYSGKALTQLGHIFLRVDDIGGAGDCYDRALERDPADEGALCAMGGLAYRMGETEIAADCFSKILARRPDHVRARFGMGAVHEARGETREAIACYEAVQKPLDVRVRLGVSYCRNGQYEEAEQILDPLYGSSLESDAVLYYLGMARAASERCDEAMGMWNTLAARHRQDQGLETGLASLYLSQALRQWESREAETLLDQALMLDARNERCRYYRALYDWKRGNLADAAERLRELAEDGGGDARVLYHLGLCLSLNGKSDEAAPYFERAARDCSNDYGRYASWAIANHHVRQGRYAEAEAALAGIA